MPLGEIAEALARVEHKLDLLLKQAGISGAPPLHFQGNICPVCMGKVDYIIDIVKNIVVRRCGCTTGKQSSVIPLTPVPQGAKNGNSTSVSPSPAE